MLKKLSKNQSGFTLIEILVVIGIIAVLATIVLIAINPARQFAQSRDSQRVSNLNAILNAIGQRIADNKGTFEGEFEVGGVTYDCPALPVGVAEDDGTDVDQAEPIDNEAGGDGIDLSCLVPTYIPDLPQDPSDDDTDDEDTGYLVFQEAIGRVHVFADEEEPAITREEPIEIVR